jgi:hypothetical protein
MADTQRDGRDGRTNGGSADRPDRGRRTGCDPVPWRMESPAGWRPGAHNGRACSGRRPHPYHGTTGNRCAERRFPRSRPTRRP